MILIESGPDGQDAFDAKLILAQRLRDRGHAVFLDAATLPANLAAAQRYALTDLLADPSEIPVSRVILIGAEDTSAETLARLRGVAMKRDVPVVATGRFGLPAQRVAATARLGYAVGRDVEIVDLDRTLPNPLPGSGIVPLATGRHAIAASGRPRLTLALSDDALDARSALPSLSLVGYWPSFTTTLLVSPQMKPRLMALIRVEGLTIFDRTDLSHGLLSDRTDLLAIAGKAPHDPFVAAAAMDILSRGGPVIDMTDGQDYASSHAPILRGPGNLGDLPAYLDASVLGNLRQIETMIAHDSWCLAHDAGALDHALGLQPPPARRPRTDRAPLAIFMPTNGVGLGHAQRSGTIAELMQSRARVRFAAFPSCIPMLAARGFSCLPLLAKSARHGEPSANDVLNAARLGRLAQPGDTFVFDGGHVFRSVAQTILKHDLKAVWIRRGLHQPGQLAGGVPDREKIFGTVIVPSEAFDELNDPTEFTPRVRRVGPVLRRVAADRAEMRSKIAGIAQTEFDQLAVSMLGSGVATQRSAHLHAIAHFFERRPRSLHLIVTWPGSIVDPSLYGFRATRVIQTHAAASCMAAADVLISAAGYNSFHEIIYGGVPAIFVPQWATYLDDQARRARAAADRGLAAFVGDTALLALERELRAFLDEGKAAEIRARLAATELPPIGTADAAAIIDAEYLR